MKALALTAALIGIGGIATAASAGDAGSKASYHTMNGRTLVWHAPKAEVPYALRGQDVDARGPQEPRIELKTNGRSGTTVETNRQDQR